jgi:hypothetical protein
VSENEEEYSERKKERRKKVTIFATIACYICDFGSKIR